MTATLERDEPQFCASCGNECTDILCEDCEARLQYLYEK